MKNRTQLFHMRVPRYETAGVLFLLIALAQAGQSEFKVKPLPLPGVNGLVMRDYFTYDHMCRFLRKDFAALAAYRSASQQARSFSHQGPRSRYATSLEEIAVPSGRRPEILDQL